MTYALLRVTVLQMAINQKALLRTADAAWMLGMSVKTIERMCRSGRLRSYRVPSERGGRGQYKIRARDLEDWIESRRHVPVPLTTVSSLEEADKNWAAAAAVVNGINGRHKRAKPTKIGPGTRRRSPILTPMATEPLMSVDEVAAALAVKPATVRSWLWSGKLPRVRLSSRAVRVRSEDVKRLIEDSTDRSDPLEVPSPTGGGRRGLTFKRTP